MLHAIGSKKELTSQAYYHIVSDILENNRFQELQRFRHHIRTTRYQHSINVSYYSYLICCRFRWDTSAAARAGLLHDFYFYENTSEGKNEALEEGSHFSAHPTLALSNAEQDFSLNAKEADSIVHHMWPFVWPRPHSREGYVVAIVDKCIALFELCTVHGRYHES